MRLSWNEVRGRATAFAEQWRDAADEVREAQSFYNDFFRVFDVERRSVARYEEHVRKLDDKDGFIDLFWPGVLLVEQKSAGRSLAGAYDQAGEYFDALKMRDRPRYILVSDFQNFELHDLDERRTVAFPLRDLPDNVEAFGFIMGVQPATFAGSGSNCWSSASRRSNRGLSDSMKWNTNCRWPNRENAPCCRSARSAITGDPGSPPS